MFSRLFSVALTLSVSCLTARTLEAAQADPKPEHPPQVSPSMVEIRDAYRQKRDEDVIVLADQALHEITLKGDLDQRAAELHFWRGAALRRLGRNKEALVALQEAKIRGFSSPELHLELALVRRSLGDAEGAEQDYREAERALPTDLEKQDRLITRWNREGKDEPRFKLSLSPQAGWDTNVVGLDPTTPLTEGNVRADSSFVGAYLELKTFLIRNDHQILELDFQNMTREYPETSLLSYNDSLVTAVGRQPVNEWADFEVRASFEEAFIRATGHYRSQTMLGAGFLLGPWGALQTRIFGDWTVGRYYESTPPDQDRDGDISRIGIEFTVDLGRSWSVAPYFTYNKDAAKGSDYVSDGWEVGVTLRPEEVVGLKISGTVLISEQDYSNANSLTNFTEKRVDHPFQVTLTVIFKQVERLIGYAPGITVCFVRHESNVSAYSYHRWSPELELGIDVLSF